MHMSSGALEGQARIVRPLFVPDLGDAIGSPRWLREAGMLIGLLVLAVVLWPGLTPLVAASAVPDGMQDEYRSQAIKPLGLGGEAGRRMGATDRVRTLAAAPERPSQQLTATLSDGASFAQLLARAGLSDEDRIRAIDLIEQAMPVEELTPGTPVDITLGRRLVEGAPRPLDRLKFRARFDLDLTVSRLNANGPLFLKREAIRVDDTPLRIRGTVGSSLYRSARAAGAPASAVQAYLKTLGGHVDLSNAVAETDTFDMIIAHRRAATGERQAGKLLYAGLERDDKPRAQLMRWGEKGKFFEASGVGEERDGLVRPVPGRATSPFGMRRHPILGYRRMHSGQDYSARHGTPIVAVTDGRVSGAGRMGGCGKAVRLRHGGGLETRYCHMSRMAVQRGQQVRRGQVIGYVGSTGLSTGPHLHYEMYRGGRAINPAGVSYVTRAQLEGEELARFRAALSRLKTVEPGAALADLERAPSEQTPDAPVREIDKLDRRTTLNAT